MDRELRRRVVEFVMRHIGETASERKAVLEGALHDCAVIRQVGDRDQNSYVFSSNMVTTLEAYGQCAGDTEPALVVLLRYLGKQKGVDVQQEADALCHDMMQDSEDTRTVNPPISKRQTTALSAGSVIANRYKLLHAIGDESGQATVWQAQDLNDPQVPPVAIKCMKPHAKRDFASRFLEEVRSVRELDTHSNIVPIYDYGIDQGLRFMVMPVMRESLRALLDQTGLLPLDDVMHYLRQVAEALDHAHQHGIVHRDLKPANMLFTRETGRLCLADFGISYRAHREAAITRTDETAATEEYAAPEQLRSTGSVTEKSDIYALAIIAYELLAGALPFTGTKAEIAAQHLQDNLELPDPHSPRVPPFVLQVLRMGAAKNAALRPPKASDFVRHLQEALDGKAPEVIEHYLSEVLPAHLQEVMPKKVFLGLSKTFVNPVVELRQQEDQPEADADEIDWELFGPEVTEGDTAESSLDIELGGELRAPREGHYSDQVEYTGNVRERIQSLRRVVLLGEPGAGKTFMVGRLALDYAEKCRTDPDALLPVFVPLSRYDTDESFEAFVAERMGALRDRLTHPDVLWLLDGLNEMPADKGQWQHLKDFIMALVKADAPFILTCRVKNYNEYLQAVPGLYRVDLQDLNPQQIYDILKHFLSERYASHIWNTVMHGSDALLAAWHAWGGSVREFWERPRDTWDRDDTKHAHLEARNQIHRDPRKLMLLCRNPFTLVQLLVMRMGKASYGCGDDLSRLARRLEEQLPNNRARLFEAVIGDMLQAEAQRQKWTGGDVSAVVAMLETCAAALQAQEQRTEMFLQDLMTAEGAAADGVMRLEMARDAGLITLNEGTVRFNHQLFQEYFATKRLRALLEDYSQRFPEWETGDALPPRDERLAELFPRWWDVGGWRVTVALLGELEGRTGIDRVARWLASDAPETAITMVQDNNDGLTLDDLSEIAKQSLIDGAHQRKEEPNPLGRAAAYRVLGLFDADKRPGVGVIVHNGVKLPDIDWVHIPAGEFTYGDDDKTDYLDWAKAADRQILTLDYDFEIARYPVTYAQFQTFIDDPEGFYDARWWEGLTIPEGHNTTQGDQAFKYWNHPRERVSWYDAVAFCRWLSWRLGGGYALDAIDDWLVRLPAEFEWEKAARANTGWAYPYGDEFDATKGNTYATGIGQTSAVGIFPDGDTPHWSKPISDLSGNVWEWCLTDYEHLQSDAAQENIGSATTDKPALELNFWMQPDAAQENIGFAPRRVLRGGSWYNNHYFARAAYRFLSNPFSRTFYYGFRLLRAGG